MKISLSGFFMCVAVCVMAGSAGADSAYPTRPITIVVPAPPGGQTDVVTRMVAQQLALKLGQPVIIENRPGAGTNIGSAYVARSAPNGYALIVIAIPFGANPALIRDLPFDPMKDFKFLVHMTSNPNVLVVNVNSPFHSLQDIINAAKADPRALTYGSAGTGSSMFLFMEMLKSMAKIDVLHVPYQGSAKANTDLMGNTISMVFDSLPGAWPLVEGKKLRAIAVSGAQRSPGAPDVPTVAESGVKGFEAESWLGLAAPAGTPDEVVQKLNRAANEVLEMPAVRAQLIALGARPVGGTSTQFDSFVKSQILTWKKVLADAGVKPN